MQIRHFMFVAIVIAMIFVTNHTGFTSAQSITDYGGHVGYRIANFTSEHSTYQIWYKITNGTVVSTPLDLSAKALIFFINATNNGHLTVELPRSIIDSKNQNDGKPFFVTTDTLNRILQINATETNWTYTRILDINFTKNTSEIKIIGNLFVEKYVSGLLDKLAPLFQFRSGVKAEDVVCNSDFQLILKSSDGSPACVKSATAAHLVKIGWAKHASYYHDIHVQPKMTLNDYQYDGIDTDYNTTVIINHSTYYQTTLGYSAYNLPSATPMQFHNVTFIFPEGTIDTPGGASVLLDIKSEDGSPACVAHNVANILVERGWGHLP